MKPLAGCVSDPGLRKFWGNIADGEREGSAPSKHRSGRTEHAVLYFPNPHPALLQRPARAVGVVRNEALWWRRQKNLLYHEIEVLRGVGR